VPASCISTRDPRDGQPLALVGDASVHWTSGARWGGVVAEHIALERLDAPEFLMPDHCVIVALAPATVEFHERGQVRSHRFAPGDVSLFCAGVPRKVRHERAEFLAVALSRTLFAQVAAGLDLSPDAELVECRCVREPCAEHIARALAAEAETGFPSGRLYGESLGMALAAHLLRAHGSTPVADRVTGGLAPRCLKRVTEYIHAHLADDVPLATLAQVANLSPHRFAHNFKQATGIAPHQYVIRARLERARTMLRAGDQSICAIAYAAGFGSPSRFALLFRRAMGVTPSAYRVSCR
jgi:AraC family transcriptional regulator